MSKKQKKFNEKQYWEERTKAYLKETKTINQWDKDHLIVDRLENDDDECEFCGPKENCTGYKCWIR